MKEKYVLTHNSCLSMFVTYENFKTRKWQVPILYINRQKLEMNEKGMYQFYIAIDKIPKRKDTKTCVKQWFFPFTKRIENGNVHTFSSSALWCSKSDLSALRTSTSLETPAGDDACRLTTVIRSDLSWRATRHSRCSSKSCQDNTRLTSEQRWPTTSRPATKISRQARKSKVLIECLSAMNLCDLQFCISYHRTLVRVHSSVIVD